jgi:cysteine-rich repeat protein
MRKQQPKPFLLLAGLSVLLALAACSDDGDADPFAECGNGILDGGEQCDDGNLIDTDDCLSTCVIAICGDGFLNLRDEDCDRLNLDDQNCTSLGFAGGTLSCDGLCYFDTSGCIAPNTPTPTRTPTQAAATSTSTGGPPPLTGTPTSTPVLRCEQVNVIVSIAYSTSEILDLAGVVVDLSYPPATVLLPGSGSDPSVAERVTDLSGANGFLQVDDNDTDQDGNDDRLRNGYATTGGTIPAGDFEAVLFDCAGEGVVPLPEDFSCAVVQSSDSLGNPAGGEVGCSIRIKPISGDTSLEQS